MKHLVVCFSAVWALTLSAPAYVLTYGAYASPQRWDFRGQTAPTNSLNPNTDAIRFHLASDAYSTTNTAAELNALRATFAQWQAVSNSIIKFEDAGLVAPRNNINTSDGTNVVFFAKTSIVNGEDITGLLGRAYVRFTVPNHVILEGDIIFNAATRTWFTDFNAADDTGILIEAVAAHEIGHLLGLAHSPVGAATMLSRGLSGIENLQAGLSRDDRTGAQFIYAVTRTNVGAIKGTVTKNGSTVLGAQVFVQDAAGNVVAGAVTRNTGAYEVNMLPPATYLVRAAPLDPDSGDRLVSAADISSEFTGADTSFLPTTNISTMVIANTTNTVNLVVSDLTPAFRITHIRAASASSGSYSWSSLPGRMTVGQSNYYIGVASANLPTDNASLHLTGDGLTFGTATFESNAFDSGLNFISIPISISSNATPGARSFVVSQDGTNVAYANGFLEIEPAFPDYNFDGFDDRFQREYFPLFTVAAAGPNAEPDGDGMNNYGEYIADTIPTNAASLLKMQSVARTNDTATVRWDSVVGKNYRVLYSTNPASGSWSNVGSVVTADDTTTALNDTAATDGLRIYRVQVLP